MKHNLSQDILDRVYQFEVRRTSTEIFLRVVSMVMGIIVAGFATIALFSHLNQFGTFEIFDGLFEEGGWVVSQILKDLDIIFYELPYEASFLFVFSTVCFIVCLIFFIRNFGKITHRILALIHHKEDN